MFFPCPTSILDSRVIAVVSETNWALGTWLCFKIQIQIDPKFFSCLNILRSAGSNTACKVASSKTIWGSMVNSWQLYPEKTVGSWIWILDISANYLVETLYISDSFNQIKCKFKLYNYIIEILDLSNILTLPQRSLISRKDCTAIV